MTFDIGLHEVCVRVGVRYVITKFSRLDSLPNFLTHGAPLSAMVFNRSQLIVFNRSQKMSKDLINSILGQIIVSNLTK